MVDLTLTPPEDFWSRRANAPACSLDLAPLGWPATVLANEAAVLEAARLSAGRFSRAEAAGPGVQVQIVVRPVPAGPLPANLVDRLAYAGVGDWISLAAGEWGYGLGNLATRTAVVFLSPALAAATRLVSRYFIDHYLLNFLLTEWAMLHASAVVDRRGRLILLVAPHNTGKSTTALRLLRAGYTFLADGMALLQPSGAGFIAGGYPVGEVKLRDDVLALFPEYSGPALRVREERKTVVDLRAAHPGRLAETLFSPAAIHLCLAERSGTGRTEIAPLSRAEAWPLLAAHTVYWDEPARLTHQAAVLQRLVEQAGLHRLRLGTDEVSLLAMMDELE